VCTATITASSKSTFGHPIRIQAYRAAVRDGLITPRGLARELDLPTENVAYHVGVLVRHGRLRLKDTVAVRGAISHRYEPVGDPADAIGAAATIVTAEAATEQLEATLRQLAEQAVASGLVDGRVRVTCLIEPLTD